MDERRRRSDLGCAAMLFAPILLVGTLALQDTSPDSDTTGNRFWAWVLLIAALAMFTTGCAIWLRARSR